MQRTVYVVTYKPTLSNPFSVFCIKWSYFAAQWALELHKSYINFSDYRIITRHLDKDESVYPGYFNELRIMKSIEWNRRDHHLFSSDFKEKVKLLTILHRISTLSWLPHDILYYLLSLLEGGRIEINTTGKLIE